MMKTLLFVLFLLQLLLPACTKQERTSPQPRTETVSADTTGDQMISRVREDLADAKGQLTREGQYNCCVKAPCDMCALMEGKCDCFEDLEKGEHVCTECYAKWQQAEGISDKFKKEDVRADFTKHQH